MSLLVVVRCTVCKGLDIGGGVVLFEGVKVADDRFFFLLDASIDALDLLHKPLAEHLRVLYQCEAHPGGLVAEYKRILMLAEL